MSRLSRVVVAVAVFFGAYSGAVANMAVVCGESLGVSYYFEGGVIPPGQGGWMEDGIKNGRLELWFGNQAVDILYTDGSGMKKSMVASGFKPMFSHFSRDQTSFLLIFANEITGVAEHYMFKFNETGAGTLVWGTVRASNDFSTKSSLYIATCQLQNRGRS